MTEITIKVPEGITKEQIESYIQSLRNDYIVKLSKEDAKAAYKELAKSKSIRDEVIAFIKMMDYIPTPSQYDFILYSIVKGSILLYEEGISTKTMSNNEFDIAYAEAKQNMYSYIRNRLEDPRVKRDYLPNKEKFIKLCETSDFVLVNGYLGNYSKEYEEIVFPRNDMCPPNIKVRDYDYHEEDGEKWILPRDCKVGGYHVQFLNEVKD